MGSFHQGDTIFGLTAGIQCAFNFFVHMLRKSTGGTLML